jgi:hypothetical protein
MSQFYEYFWDNSKVNGIALLQTPIDGNNLILNGGYANPVTNIVNLLSQGFCSEIAITCEGNLSAVNFIIIGTQNGVPVSEILKGVLDDFTVSENVYDTITSIKVEGIVSVESTVSVGIGSNGYFPIILINTEKGTGNISYALNFVPSNCSYRIYGALKNVMNSKLTYDDLIDNDEMILIPLEQNDVLQNVQFTSVYKYILIAIFSTDIESFSTLRMQFLQL